MNASTSITRHAFAALAMATLVTAAVELQAAAY